jgi:hypothetical protein
MKFKIILSFPNKFNIFFYPTQFQKKTKNLNSRFSFSFH